MSGLGERERIYRFGEFRVQSGDGRLLRGDREVHVEGRVVDLLLALLRSRGRTLSRTQLRQELWGSTTVSDGSLRRTVSLLRKALDDRGPDGAVVETVHGRGYRFAGDVRVTETDVVVEGHRGDSTSPAVEISAPRESTSLSPSPASTLLDAARL